MSSFYSYLHIFHSRPLGKNNYFAKQSLQMSVSSLIQQRIWKTRFWRLEYLKTEIASVKAATVIEAFEILLSKTILQESIKTLNKWPKSLPKSSKTHITERHHKTGRVIYASELAEGDQHPLAEDGWERKEALRCCTAPPLVHPSGILYAKW